MVSSGMNPGEFILSIFRQPIPRNDSSYILWAISTTKSALFYGSLIQVPIGILLNNISIWIFSRQKFKVNTMGFYYIIMAIFDNLSMVVAAVVFFGVSVDYDLSDVSNASCKTLTFLLRMLLEVPSWLQVLVTFDRLVFVIYQNKFKFLTKKRYIALFMFIIGLLTVLASIPNLYYQLSPVMLYNPSSNSTNVTVIVYSCTSTKSIELARDLLSILVRTILPFLLIGIGNFLLIRSLYHSRMRMRRSSLTRGTLASMRREHHFVVSIIATDLLFVAVLIPLAVTLILIDLNAYNPLGTTAKSIATNALAYYISALISLTPCSLSFLINLKFNKLFRRELLRALNEIGLKVTHVSMMGSSK